VEIDGAGKRCSAAGELRAGTLRVRFTGGVLRTLNEPMLLTVLQAHVYNDENDNWAT
jgi:hypothetical protein